MARNFSNSLPEFSGVLVLWLFDGSCVRMSVSCADSMAALCLVAEWFFGRLDCASCSLWVPSRVSGGRLVRFAHRRRI